LEGEQDGDRGKKMRAGTWLIGKRMLLIGRGTQLIGKGMWLAGREGKVARCSLYLVILSAGEG
jgi:hypothetical protein